MELFALLISEITIIAMSIIATILFCFIVKNIKREKVWMVQDDGTSPKFYITGDKHRNFTEIKKFCREMHTKKKDVLIILGDSGFNYYGDLRDDQLKAEIGALNITLFCLHGNKENRPQNIATYGIRNFCGGKAYYEPRFPNILFAIDGEIYLFEGRKYLTVGGAHSVDKMQCLEEGRPFWEDEMPDESVMAATEARLADENNRIYGILTHTCPLKYLPTEMFLSARTSSAIKRNPWRRNKKNAFQPDINRATEEWLDRLEGKMEYTVWYCGHYHIDKEIDKIHMMFREIRPLHSTMHMENTDSVKGGGTCDGS